MKYSALLCLFVLLALSVAEESSKEEESKETSEDTQAKIRQCTCTEMHECGEKMREKFKPCAEKCLEELTNSDWDEEQGRQCFVPKQPRKKHCFEEIKKQT